MFKNRVQAASLLADLLEKHRSENPLILAIPRGGVVIGRKLAERLGAELDVALIQKLRSPVPPGHTIGSVNDLGDIYVGGTSRLSRIPDASVRKLATSEMTRLARRKAMYRAVRPEVSPRGRTVILADDGVCSGASMMGGIRALRAKGATKIIIAAPVAPHDAMARLVAAANEVVTVSVPDLFFNVAECYDEFPNVTDEEVTRILSETSQAGQARARAA